MRIATSNPTPNEGKGGEEWLTTEQLNSAELDGFWSARDSDQAASDRALLTEITSSRKTLDRLPESQARDIAKTHRALAEIERQAATSARQDTDDST
jgi:hypothetical protein